MKLLIYSCGIQMGMAVCGIAWRIDESKYEEIHFPIFMLALAFLLAFLLAFFLHREQIE